VGKSDAHDDDRLISSDELAGLKDARVQPEPDERVEDRPTERLPVAGRSRVPDYDEGPLPVSPAPVVVVQQPKRGFWSVVGTMVKGFMTMALVFTVIVAGIVGYAAIKIWPHIKNPIPAQTIDRSQPPLLKSIQDLSRYVAAEGNFQEVIDLQHNRKYVPDFLVNDRTLFVAVATVEVYVDFGAIGDGAIKASDDRKTVEINLPAPSMGKPNIDHAKSYVVAEQKGALNRLGDVFGSDPNKEQEVYVKAEQQIGEAAKTSGLADRAQVNTRKMLEGMLHGLGFVTVTINFAKP
jgi:hypothetical protein